MSGSPVRRSGFREAASCPDERWALAHRFPPPQFAPRKRTGGLTPTAGRSETLYGRGQENAKLAGKWGQENGQKEMREEFPPSRPQIPASCVHPRRQSAWQMLCRMPSQDIASDLNPVFCERRWCARRSEEGCVFHRCPVLSGRRMRHLSVGRRAPILHGSALSRLDGGSFRLQSWSGSP